MKAYFLGGELHGQERNDPGTPSYKHKHGGIPKKGIGRAWTVATPDQVYSYFRLEKCAPLEEDLEVILEGLGFAL